MQQVVRAQDVRPTTCSPACQVVVLMDGMCALTLSADQQIHVLSYLLQCHMSREWVNKCMRTLHKTDGEET